MVAVGPCFMCRVPFSFHPDLVTSVLIDPQTGLAPDLGGDPDRAQREPICPACCHIANDQRRQAGLELLDERDSLDRVEDTW
jgi:hypothetical protein